MSRSKEEGCATKMPDSIERLNQRYNEIEQERGEIKSQLDRDRLTKATTSVVEAITSAPFIERMREFRERAARGDVALEEVSQLLSVDGLRAAGAELPDDFRLSSRTFEDFQTGTRIDIRPGNVIGDIGMAPQWGACAGGGAATVCGCAGGST